MYPDWPESVDDLVPLPQCEGPKLKPFDFQGPQKIKFLEYVGAGLHSHVFKVEILGQIYALKLFKFSTAWNWLGPDYNSDWDDVKLMTTFANYSEPFNCECRAFGRLHESNNAQLAVQCFGYVLLDEDHESAMLDQFMDKGYDYSDSTNLRQDFNVDETNAVYMDSSLRSKFPGKTGRPPPIRGVVKTFIEDSDENLRPSTLLKVKRDMIAIQQLGIMSFDVACRNVREGTIVDFSKAITTPHYITTPELNPHLTPEWISAMEFETFQFAINDYVELEDMVEEWNEEHELEKDHISFFVFPPRRYELRKRSDERLYSLVDPRLHDWRTFATASTHSQRKTDNRRSPRNTKQGSSKSRGAISKPYRQLYARPPRWYFDCDGNSAAKGRNKHSDYRSISTSLDWEFKDGFLFPHEKM